MKRYRAILIVCLIIIFASLIYSYSGRCYVDLPEGGVLIIKSEGQTGFDNCFAQVSISFADSKLSLFPRKLITAGNGCGLIDRCLKANNLGEGDMQCFQKSNNQMLILSTFYSNDNGRTFVHVWYLRDLIEKSLNEKNLRVCYPKVEGNNLILTFSTYEEHDIDKEFISTDGGKTFKRLLQ